MSASTSALEPQQGLAVGAPRAVRAPRVCLVGMNNLAVLAREYSSHGAAGEQVQHTLLAKALVRAGYDVCMVTADYGQQDGAVWDAVRTYKAFAPQAGLPVLRFIHPRWSGLWSALKRANADVYYTSCAGAVVGQIAMYCRKHGRQFIYRVASDTDCEPDRLLVQYWRDRKLYEYGLRRADAVLAQSKHQQDLLERNYGVRSSLAGLLVEHGEVRSLLRRDITVLWVNNFRPLKRPELLLDAAARLGELSFHIAGGPSPGQHELFAAMQERARGHANVTFHGRVPYHEVNVLYERARVFVNTSDIEGFPNSYLQAWARGTPVVAFFDPDGLIAREGLGVAVRSTDELVSAVNMLATDASVWAAASARCRAFMAREYGEDRVLTPYRTAIDALHARRRQ